MLWWTCYVVLYVAIAAANEPNKQKWLDLNIEQGPVRGHRDDTGNLYVFHNIPYATAPTGDNKFKGPLPPPTWTETFDAIDKKIICPQFILKQYMSDNFLMQENCLVANVYVPDTVEKNLSVLVYVHGGAFQLGYGDWVKMKNLMKKKDIITVTFNYRLSIHGFLNLGTKDAPGNSGMKDQVMLLRWVQQNIVAFGGNPNDVTIAGYSAGSAAVDLLMISKSAKGLFHKVIPESGSCLGAFAVQSDPLKSAKEHAKKLNFTNVDDVYALEQFYKTLSYDTLTADPFMDLTDATSKFGPSLEHDTADEPFLTKSPLSILKSGDFKKVPLLYGLSNLEGKVRVELFDVLWKDKMNEKFSDFLPGDLQFESENEKEEVAKQIKEFYFHDKPLGSDNILRYVEYISDIIMVSSILRAVKLYAEAGHDEIYLYEYSFEDENTPKIPYTNVRGADHCSQTMAVGDGANLTHVSEEEITEEFKNMKMIIRELWHNFIKTGKPVPEGSTLPAWPAAGADRSPHMSLGQKVELRGTLAKESVIFWDKIYEKYYREPQSPPKATRSSHIEL